MREARSKGSSGGRIKAVFLRAETPMFLVYAAVTAFMTWPAITLVHRTYAEPRDPLGVIWTMWWYKYSFLHHLPVSHVTVASYPFGMKVNTFLVDPLTGLLLRGLSMAAGETIAYNIFLLACFFLAAISMYFLVRYLTGSRWAAFYSGLVFAFCPYMLMHGKEHLGLAATFWIPLFFLFLIRAWRRRTLGSILLAALVLLVLSLFSYNYSLLASIFAATFILAAWLLGRPWKKGRDWRLLLRVLPIAALVFVLLVALFIVLESSPAGSHNYLRALYNYSARPWDYLLPTAEGAALGWTSRAFINSHPHGGFLVESSLFLGYIPLFLAFYALLLSLRRRTLRAASDGRSRGLVSTGGNVTTTVSRPQETSRSAAINTGHNRRIIWAFAVSGAVAFIFSMPPTARILGVNVYFPSYLIYKLVPQYRAYARFGLMVLFAVAVLAGFAVDALSRKFRPGWRRTAFLAALCALVLVEFSVVPPFRALDTNATTDYYRWLKDQKGKVAVAIYPMFYSDDFRTYEYLFQQRLHRKNLLNGARYGSEAEDYRETMVDLLHPATPGLLRALGAKYVMVLPGYYLEGNHINYPYPLKFEESRLPGGLKLEREFNKCLVYRVTAAPSRVYALFTGGICQPYMDPRGVFWHPGGNIVTVNIKSELPDTATRRLKFRAKSPRSPASLRVGLNGKSIGDFKLAPWPREIETGPVTLRPGTNTLTLESTGTPVVLEQVPLHSEMKVSVLVSNILVVEGGQ